jgi:hypothetical protein
MPLILIHHRREPADCGAVFASFRGFDNPTLCHRRTLASCWHGGHAIWWSVDAATAAEALGLFAYYVGERASVMRVDEIEIP